MHCTRSRPAGLTSSSHIFEKCSTEPAPMRSTTLLFRTDEELLDAIQHLIASPSPCVANSARRGTPLQARHGGALGLR